MLFYIDLIFDEVSQYKYMLSAILPLVDQLEVLGEYMSAMESLNQIHKQS